MPSILHSPLFTICDLLAELNASSRARWTHRRLRDLLMKKPGCLFQIVPRGTYWTTPERLRAAFPDLADALLDAAAMRDERP